MSPFQEALNQFGQSHQLRKLQEECGELIQAVNKYLNKECSEEEMSEELADVWILMEQMQLAFPKTFEAQKHWKLCRLRFLLSRVKPKSIGDLLDSS